tara:strand:+ start:116 stop:511 length:396 start_codon:yes stop_codon:yes gene_type:complete
MSKKTRARNNKTKKDKTKKGMTESHKGPVELPEGTRTYTTLTEDDMLFMIHLINHHITKAGVKWYPEYHYFQLGSIRVKEGDQIVLQGASGSYFCFTYHNLGQYINKCRDLGSLEVVEYGQSLRQGILYKR